MDWNQLISIAILISVFSIFITSIIEVIKGISAIGFVGMITDVWKTLIHNTEMKADTFPALNFFVAMVCCWAFNITIMSAIFQPFIAMQLKASSPAQMFVARWIDYFGTASVTYLGANEFFKRVIAVKKQVEEATKT